jgi:hypothetical protein
MRKKIEKTSLDNELFKSLMNLSPTVFQRFVEEPVGCKKNKDRCGPVLQNYLKYKMFFFMIKKLRQYIV